MTQQLRQRWQDWWLARHPRQDQQLLQHRNVYILPSRAGLGLGATLLLLLVSAINYQLNLGYALTFLISGCVVVAMHQGHATLRGLNLHLQSPDPVHAGTPASVTVHLHNPLARPRYALALAWQGQAPSSYVNLGPHSQTQLRLQLGNTRRGLQPLPALRISTLFPLGCFKVWSIWRCASELLVYPSAERGAPALPGLDDRSGQGALARASTTPTDDGLRPYRVGDPLKSIAWKQVARTGQLITRQGEDQPAQALWLSPQHTGLSDPEAQLSRLCAWILQAHAQGLRYGLRLGQTELAPAQGEQHLAQCLRALALA